jgi:uncharacterized damage-inducible protein DinB
MDRERPQSATVTLMATTELQRLLLHNAAFTPPLRIVSAIPEKIRTLRTANVPHSIAEELWHIVYWQDHFLRWARREELAYPEHAELGWRKMESLPDAEWRELVRQFEASLTEASALAGQTGLQGRYSTLEEPGSDSGPLTLMELLANLAVHNAYHLGRIVLLRQISGDWPPPGGGDTW